MNLFSNWINSLISLFVLYILIQFVPWILNWTIFAADFKYNFNGEEIINREMCSRVLDPENGGACWAIIYVRFYQFMYGFYPREEVWRVNLSYIMLAVAVVPLLFDKFPFRKHFLKFTYVFPIIAFFLLNGGLGLESVSTNKWGGLLVTLVLGFTGIALANAPANKLDEAAPIPIVIIGLLNEPLIDCVLMSKSKSSDFFCSNETFESFLLIYSNSCVSSSCVVVVI